MLVPCVFPWVSPGKLPLEGSLVGFLGRVPLRGLLGVLGCPWNSPLQVSPGDSSAGFPVGEPRRVP